MDVTRSTSQFCRAVALTLLPLSLLAGCVTTDVRAPSWSMFDGPSHGQVGQIVAMWAETVVEQPDRQTGVPMPGFSGRAYLFSTDHSLPLGADGMLRVYLFDCADSRGPGAPALEVWELGDAQLKLMLKKDGVGWGYNLWLPWSTRRPGIARVAIRMQYVPRAGMPLWSDTNEIAVDQPLATIKTTSQNVTPRGSGANLARQAAR